MRRKRILWIPAAIAGMVLFAFIGGEVVMRLWNWLLPDLFGFKHWLLREAEAFEARAAAAGAGRSAAG